MSEKTASDRGPRPIWMPDDAMVENAEVTRFMSYLREAGAADVGSYEDLWGWSVENLSEFWEHVWRYFEVGDGQEPGEALVRPAMPGAIWFPDVRLNYAEHVFRGKSDDAIAILSAGETRRLEEMTWGSLRTAVGELGAALRSLGVVAGDRVVGYLPNGPEAVVAFLACASIGAVWSSASPDFGAGSVLDRFGQIEPKVLFAADEYSYGGRRVSRVDAIKSMQQSLPNLLHTIIVPGGPESVDDAVRNLAGETTTWDRILADHRGAKVAFEQLPFDHPLWILYSSGTTGLPKAIVQGHGGILLEHLKVWNFHVNPKPGERVFWFTTTGWMMWNFLVSGLLTEAAIVLYDGNPGKPDLNVLWDLADSAEVGIFGTSAAFLSACMKADVSPSDQGRCRHIRAIGSTGSPLAMEAYDWVLAEFRGNPWLFSISGGTDLCSALVGGVPTLPVFRGEIQARMLGAAVDSWDEEGNSLVGAVGELVVTEPMPSMPLYLWGDEDGSRYRDSYFDMFPGIWRHGDWIEITPRGTSIIYGRSDATINRGGIRMGTAEIYRAVLERPEVLEALVVDLPRADTDGWIALFVVLRDQSAEIDDALATEIRNAIKERCSPRHRPDAIFAIEEIPRTHSGKSMEVPVKRILMGERPEAVVGKGSIANPRSLDFLIDLAGTLADGGNQPKAAARPDREVSA